MSYQTGEFGTHTQHAVRGDGTSATAAIRPVGLDGELALLSWAHVKETLVPALDDLALADSEAKGLSAVVGGVELAAVALEGAAVVHLDAVTGLCGALALDSFGDFGLEVLGALLAVIYCIWWREEVYVVVDDVGESGGSQSENNGDLHDCCRICRYEWRIV